MFHGFSIDVRWMFGRCSIDAPFPISDFLISDFQLPIVYVYVPFRSSFAHFPLPMARPGGMRGAIESAALAVGMARRVKPKPQKSECQSQSADHNPPKNPPSAPAHSARPTHLAQGPGFCDFQKTIASAERGAKKLCTQPLGNNLHRKCKLQDASLMIFMF